MFILARPDIFPIIYCKGLLVYGFEIQSLNDSLFTIHPKIVFSLIFGFKYVVKLISSEIFLSLLGLNVADSGFQ